jgi:GAF domain-containing protein
MKRRSRAGGELIKGRRPKTPEPKRPDAAKAGVPANSSLSGSATELARLGRELNEAVAQQKATTDVLRVISSSPGQLEPVFRAMLEDAVRLLEAKFGTLFLCEGNPVRPVAGVGLPPKLRQFQAQRGAFVPPPGLPLARLIETKKVVHMLDDPERLSPATRLGGARSHIAVPMLKEGKVVGAIYIYRQEVKPFTDKQIELVSNFATQAVIAIENARLLNELRQRTTDLTEALEQQTGTSEVLQVISSSPGDLKSVFPIILENATRLCAASFGILWLCEGTGVRCVALHNAPAAFAEDFQSHPVVYPPPGSGLSLLVETRQVTHVADMAATHAYTQERARQIVAAVELGGARTFVHVPMLKDSSLIGVITVFRQEVRPFNAKQIALLQNFATQAVIAIENARLLNELRQRTTDLTERTADLTEALEQQMATSEVLQVISSSLGDLEPVFASMLENAVRICDATFGNIYRWDGEALHLLAAENTPPAFAEARKRLPRHPSPNTPAGRTIATRTAVHVADLAAEQAYVEHHDPATVEAVELGGVRTFISVPLLKEDELIGTFSLARQEIRPFSDKQIALVTNFAAQAVIAIENARLLNELRQKTTDLTERTADLSEALEQQTATSEVLQVISSSPGDLEPVFAAMLGSAARICKAEFGNLFLHQENAFRAVAWHGELTYVNTWQGPARIIKTDEADIPLARVAATKQRVHVADLRQEAAYEAGFAPLVALVDKGGRANHSARANAQGAYVGWCNHPLSSGSSSFHRQADRACRELRRAGGDCNRERKAAPRTSRKNRSVGIAVRGACCAQPTTRTTRHRPSRRNRTHEQAAALLASAGG